MEYIHTLIIAIIITTVILLLNFLITAPPRNLFKDMPKDIFRKGKFKGCSIKWVRFGNPTIYESRYVFKYILTAYLCARFKACLLDYKTVGLTGFVDIGWKIKEQE